MPRFQVFSQRLQIAREGARWQVYALGADGKRRRAEVVVPDFVEDAELEQFLFDLFHEQAVPGAGDVRRLPEP